MKSLLQNMTETLADAALLEMGIPGPVFNRRTGLNAETLEENFIEVAFAEAADYDEVHEEISRDHRKDRDMARSDDCNYGDTHRCFV